MGAKKAPMIKKLEQESGKLRKNITWIVEVRRTLGTKDIMIYLKQDFGKVVSKRTMQRHLKEIKLERLVARTKAETAKKQKVKELQDSLRKTRKAERKNQYPYYVISPCEHHVKIKLTNNPVQSGGCTNCGCEYDRKKGIWVNRFTRLPWGKEPKVHPIGAGKSGWF